MSDSNMPIFDFGSTFDAVVMIGERQLPLIITRLSRGQMQEFEKSFMTFFAHVFFNKPLKKMETEEFAKFEKDAVDFTDRAIKDYITVKEGLLVDHGKPVTTGNGIIEMFHARPDVLGGLLMTILMKNKLTHYIVKNSSPLRDSDIGLPASTLTRGGERPGEIAPNVDSLTSADHGGAMSPSPTSSGASTEAQAKSVTSEKSSETSVTEAKVH